MVKKIFFVIVASLSFTLVARAQFNVSFEGNGQWYIDDNKIELKATPQDPDDSTRFRSNAYLKLDYAIKNWDFGVQIESYLPKALLNYSPNLDGVNIGTLHARYHNVKLGLDITGGHLYEQFGNGLILRTWEDRQLGINNSILGGRIAYMPINGLKLTVLAGKQRVGMGFDFSDGVIYGADLSSTISELFSIQTFDMNVGFSYVGRYENLQETNPELPTMTNAYSARIDFAQKGFYIRGEYAYKSEDALIQRGRVLTEPFYSGQALLVNFGYSQKGLGIDVNLRRLENMGFSSQRNLAGNSYNEGILNYLPALTKQYDYSLQNIYIYQAQPYLEFIPSQKAGEIGGQIDIIYELKKGSTLGGKYGTNIAVNASYWAGLKTTFNEADRTYTSDFFGFGKKYYYDLGIEMRKKCSKQWSFIAMYLHQYYDAAFLNPELHAKELYTNTLSGETTFKFGKAQSIKVELQHQWAKKESVEQEGVYHSDNWWAAGAEYTLNHHWSCFLTDMYNYGGDADAKIHYYNVGITFVQNATRIAVSYGRQRGGLLCVGGVCRLVPEAAGLTLNISTSF